MKKQITYADLVDISRSIRFERDDTQRAVLMEQRREMEREYFLTEQLRITRQIANLADEMASLPDKISAAESLKKEPNPKSAVTIRQNEEMLKRLTESNPLLRENLYQSFLNKLTKTQRARVEKYFTRAKGIGYISFTANGYLYEEKGKSGRKSLFARFIRETLRPNSTEGTIPYKAIENLFGIKKLWNAVDHLREIPNESPKGWEELKRKIFYN